MLYELRPADVSHGYSKDMLWWFRSHFYFTDNCIFYYFTDNNHSTMPFPMNWQSVAIPTCLDRIKTFYKVNFPE